MICYKKDFFKIMSRFNLMNIEQKVQKDLTTVQKGVHLCKVFIFIANIRCVNCQEMFHVVPFNQGSQGELTAKEN